MRTWCPCVLTAVALVMVPATFDLGTMRVAAQARPDPARPGPYTGPRTADGKPDLNGVWQVFNSAHWDIEAHSPEEGVPGGQGVVEGGVIPYKPEALARKKESYANRAALDPLSKCFLPGVPRITYVPMPFEIFQTPKYVGMAYEFAHARRIIYTDGSPHVEALEFWLGDSRGRWEGDTLVASTNNFNDKTWFDKAGNYHSEADVNLRRSIPIALFTVAAAVVALAPGRALSQTNDSLPGAGWKPATSNAAIPRTPWGDPDISGMYEPGHIDQPAEVPRGGPWKDRPRPPASFGPTDVGARDQAYSDPTRKQIPFSNKPFVVDPPDGKIPMQPWVLAKRKEIFEYACHEGNRDGMLLMTGFDIDPSQGKK